MYQVMSEFHLHVKMLNIINGIIIEHLINIMSALCIYTETRRFHFLVISLSKVINILL